MPTRFPMLTLFPCIAALPFSAPVMAAERHMPPATAYVRQGDTYIVSVPGMGIRLTHDGHNEAPLWSPDGRYLTYVKDGKAGHSALCIHDTETGFRRIIRDLDTDTAAPDDYRSVAHGALAYITNGSLHITDYRGTFDRIIFRRKGGPRASQRVVSARIAPGGGKVAFATMSQNLAGDRETYSQVVWLQDLQSQGHPMGPPRRALASHGHEDAPFIAGWTADSGHVLAWSEIYYPAGSMNADGVNLYSIAAAGMSSPIRISEPPAGLVLDREDSLSFAPKGSLVAVTIGASRSETENKSLMIFDAASGERRRITWNSNACSAPAWSPDGKAIAFLSVRADPEASWIANGARIRAWIAAPNGMDAHMLATDAGYGDTRPQWLDRDHIVFGRWRRDSALMDLWTCDKRGRGLTRIDSEVAEDGYAVRPFSH